MRTVNRVEVVEGNDGVNALAHPVRLALLDAMRTPTSAANAARAIGQPRQRANYHVKALLDAGLIEGAGERRNGNFVEQLYRSVAGTFVVSPRLAWGEQRAHALAQQLPLEQLVELGERVQRDAIELLDRATFDGDEIPSLTVEADVGFASPEAREAFMHEYLAAIKPLLKRYGARGGERFNVAVAVYPNKEKS